MKPNYFIVSVFVLLYFTVASLKAQYSDLYLLGNATPAGWNISNPSQFVKDVSNPNIFTWEGTLTAGELKIPTYKGDWGGDFIVADAPDHDLSTTNYIVSKSIDNKWVVSSEGLYRITVNLSTGTVSFESINIFSNLYILGSATRAGWSISNPAPMLVDPTNTGVFTWEGTLKSGELKISTFKGDWGHGDYILPPVNGASFVSTNYIIRRNSTDNKWNLGADGKYRISVDMNAGTVEFTPITYYSKLYLLGNASSAGWNPFSPIEMEKDVTDCTVFTYRGQFTNGNFRVHAYIGNLWQGDVLVPNNNDNASISNDGSSLGFNVNDGISTVPEWNWLISEGDYLITVNLSTQSIDIRKQYELNGNGNLSSNTNWNSSSLPSQGADIIVNSGELTVDENANLNRITLSPGAKLTLNNGNTLTTTNGVVLESNATEGTATIVDNYSTPTINATVKQYVSAGRNWYMSAPLNSANVSVLNRGASVQHYNEVSGEWEVASGTMTSGRGYIQVANSSQGTTGTLDFTGTTNSGDIAVTLTNSSVGGKGFNLVGNPYPSYLNWSAVVANNVAANMPTGTMWYRTINYNGKNAWTPSTTYSLDDVVYNGTRFYKVTTAGTSSAVGGPTGTTSGIADGSVVWNYEGTAYVFATVNADGIATPSTVSNLIPPMQAFWVKSTGGTLTFKNSMRQHETVINRLKAPEVFSNTMPFVRLSVSNGVLADEAVIYAAENANNAFDKYDAPKYFNTKGSNQPEIYTQVGSEMLVVNAMNEITHGTEIPLGFATEKQNDFCVSATEIKNLGTEMKIFIKDTQTNADFDLSSGQSYSFSSDIVNNSNRFRLQFRAAGVSTADDNSFQQNARIFVNEQNQITIIVAEKSNFAIYNAIGQMIDNGIVSNTEHKTLYKKLNSGVYMVNVNGKTQKIIIK